MDTDDLTATNIAADISAILDDYEPPPDPNAPTFEYESVGGEGSWGFDWFVVLVVRNDGVEAVFRVVVEPHTARDISWVGPDQG